MQFFMQSTSSKLRLHGLDVQADLSQWVHMSEGMFSHVAAHIIDHVLQCMQGFSKVPATLHSESPRYSLAPWLPRKQMPGASRYWSAREKNLLLFS